MYIPNIRKEFVCIRYDNLRGVFFGFLSSFLEIESIFTVDWFPFGLENSPWG